MPGEPELTISQRQNIQALVTDLGSRQQHEAEQAQRQLAELGSVAQPLLRDGLKTDNAQQARRIVEILAVQGNSELVELLLAQCYLAPQDARSAIFLELQGCLRRYGMSPAESALLLDTCTWALVPLMARGLRELLHLSWPPGFVTFEELKGRLVSDPPKKESAACLIALLERVRTGNTALVAAQTLAFLADVTPSPTLRQALPLLRPSWRHPFPPVEFTDAARAIERATASWKDLPVPADHQCSETQNLPVPVDNLP